MNTLFIVFWDLFILLNLVAAELFFVLSNTKSESFYFLKVSHVSNTKIEKSR
jgi:hypothetical protein